MEIYLDKAKKAPAIKSVNGVQNGPVTFDFLIDETENFKAAGFPYSRLHDTEMLYGAGDFVNIHCIFPDMSADPNDPSAYNFKCTDEYIKAIYDAGTKVFYRLGESIENNPRFKRYTVPPRDYEKWADVCCHIVAHYNEGWADGFHYGIEYFEIWNEPENPPMWTGTADQYYELYRVTANKLKKRFPYIKVGGYGSCGFYSVLEKYSDPFYKSFLSYARGFLSYITAEETKAPLDFFSWHVYTDDPDEIAVFAAYCRKLLDEFGFTEAESVLDEWNYNAPGETDGRHRKSIKAAVFVGETLIRLQKLPVDLAMYYDAQVMLISYCGLFNEYTKAPEKPFYAMLAFNKVKQFGCPIESSDEDGVFTLASASDDGYALMITNFNDDQKSITVHADAKTANIYTLNGVSNLELTNTLSGNFDLTLEPNTLVYAEFLK